MKYATIVILALSLSSAAFAAKYVSGYTKKDGTYVQGHYKTERNNTKFDNYSTKGNTNPYTGKKGTVDPYAESE
jgi:hypothetical protein